MAFPHSGVLGAARDPLNGIMQPNDIGGLGDYNIHASVPSPAVNVLCAELTYEEVRPMVYSEWPSPYFNGTKPSPVSWPNDFNLTLPTSLIDTTVDDVFGFDESQVHPIFPKIPLSYNTVLNNSKLYGPKSIYLLAASPSNELITSSSNNYTLCSIRGALSPDCSTEYHCSMSGGSLSSRCNDPKDHRAYHNAIPDVDEGVFAKDWISVASEWGQALALNDGILDGLSSNARLLTQLIPTTNALDPTLPSISEAIAVLAGCTLLLSALDAPFVHHWNYSVPNNILDPPQYQAFNADLKSAAFQSGNTKPWQGMFYVVLMLGFLINLCCLIYFLASDGLMTDFMEPQNLFCLSLLSPPSKALEGSCGGGPGEEHLTAGWNVRFDQLNKHFWFETSDANDGITHKSHKGHDLRDEDGQYAMEDDSISRAYSRIRKNRTSRL